MMNLNLCVCREVITLSQQQRALQHVFEPCWEEPVLLWPRPQPLLTGNSLRITKSSHCQVSLPVCLCVCQCFAVHLSDSLSPVPILVLSADTG